MSASATFQEILENQVRTEVREILKTTISSSDPFVAVEGLLEAENKLVKLAMEMY
jgi:hypothetical protein